MPLKLNIGLSRKVGEANYGSRGASVNVEVEVDSSLAAEPGKLQEKIRAVFNLVRASVNEELNGGNGHENGGHDNHAPLPSSSNTNGQGNHQPQPNGNGQSNGQTNGRPNSNGYRQPADNGNGNGNSNGQRQNNSNGNAPRPATQSQVRAIRAISTRLQINLDKLLQDRFRLSRPEDLSIRDASSLIDELKKEGS